MKTKTSPTPEVPDALDRLNERIAELEWTETVLAELRTIRDQVLRDRGELEPEAAEPEAAEPEAAEPEAAEPSTAREKVRKLLRAYGSMRIVDLATKTGLTQTRIGQVLKHAWFTKTDSESRTSGWQLTEAGKRGEESRSP